jgi:hypothetical protein
MDIYHHHLSSNQQLTTNSVLSKKKNSHAGDRYSLHKGRYDRLKIIGWPILRFKEKTKVW